MPLATSPLAGYAARGTLRAARQCTALALLAAPLHGQIRASERATVSQTIDGTTVTVEYSRPQVRGRDSLFGGVVHWGETWTPGANWATTFTADKAITLNGHAVAAGSYSLWFEVQSEAWTVILHPEARRFHTQPPAAADGQLRFTVTPEPAPHQEILTFWFPEVKATGAVLRFAWGSRSLPFDIRVEPSMSFTVAADVAEPLLGTWHQTGMGPDTMTVEIRHDGEHLVLHWNDAPPEFAHVWLIALGEGMFRPVFLSNGEPFDVETDMVVEFTPLDGRATAFEVRGIADELMATGFRK